VVDFGRALGRRESEEGVWENDEPDFHWGVCLDGFELVETTPTWIRSWCE